jgi:hypothetical protein
MDGRNPGQPPPPGHPQQQWQGGQPPLPPWMMTGQQHPPLPPPPGMGMEAPPLPPYRSPYAYMSGGGGGGGSGAAGGGGGGGGSVAGAGGGGGFKIPKIQPPPSAAPPPSGGGGGAGAGAAAGGGGVSGVSVAGGSGPLSRGGGGQRDDRYDRSTGTGTGTGGEASKAQPRGGGGGGENENDAGRRERKHKGTRKHRHLLVVDLNGLLVDRRMAGLHPLPRGVRLVTRTICPSPKTHPSNRCFETPRPLELSLPVTWTVPAVIDWCFDCRTTWWQVPTLRRVGVRQPRRHQARAGRQVWEVPHLQPPAHDGVRRVGLRALHRGGALQVESS